MEKHDSTAEENTISTEMASAKSVNDHAEQKLSEDDSHSNNSDAGDDDKNDGSSHSGEENSTAIEKLSDQSAKEQVEQGITEDEEVDLNSTKSNSSDNENESSDIRSEDDDKAELRRNDQWTPGLVGATPPRARELSLRESGGGNDVEAAEAAEEVVVKKTDFNHVDFTLCIISTVFYLLDWGINILMFQKYFKLHQEHTSFVAYFWLTFVFVISTSVVTMIFEVVWYIDEKDKFGKGLSCGQWIVRILFLVTLLGPAFRYFEVLHYAYTNLHKKPDPKDKENVVRKSMEMKADADFFYMLEKFTESALHLVLQMYIVKRELQKGDEELIGAAEALKIIIAVILMPYTVTVYCRSQRQSKPLVNDMSVVATLVQFFSRFCIILSQAAALSLFLAMYPLIFVVLIVIHYFIMVVWVFVQKTKFCKWLWLECVYRLFTAFIYLFNYFNVTQGQESYYKALVFYSYIFLERGLMMCFWCQEDVQTPNVYRWPVLFGYFFLFVTGISIKVYYYSFHHPTRKPPTDLSRKILALPNRASKTDKAEGTEMTLIKRGKKVTDSEV